MTLRISSLSKSFPNVHGGDRALALDGVDLTAPKGAFVTLLGPSGCGKSTLLNLIAGLEKPTAGKIEIDGRVVVDCDADNYAPPGERNVAMVFQSYAIWPHMTVRENIEFPIRFGSRAIRDRAEIHRAGESALRKVRLEQFADRPAPLLSGGQQQRVSLARALAQEPALLLLDEPLSNLDASLREEMQREIRSIVTEAGITAVYVTHDQHEALSMSDVIVLLRDGRVEQIGSPREIYARPRTRFAAQFVGSSNLFEASVVGIDVEAREWTASTPIGTLRVSLQEGRPVVPGASVTLVLKPEDIRVLPARSGHEPDCNVIEATVDSSVYLGSRVELDCSAGGAGFCAFTSASAAPDGRSVRVSLAPEVIHYL